MNCLLTTLSLLIFSACCEEVKQLVVTSSGEWNQSVEAIQVLDGSSKAEDFVDAIQVNIRPDLQHLLAPVVAAIRHAERGGPGREYGILNPRAEVSYRAQAGWCAATVQKNYDRWQNAKTNTSFIHFLGSRYAPIGADNDPTGLNRNWVPNVNHYFREFRL